MSSPRASGVTRRTFVAGIAAVPLAAQLGGSWKQSSNRPHVAVIGASAFGGWVALELLRRGAAVTLLDAWGPGNRRASSGGETRVIRAIYGPDRVYVDMVKRSFELWAELDASTGEPLYVETGVMWMHRGDDAYVRSSHAILRDAGFPLDQLTVTEAKRRYPQINFSGITSVWIEKRAGALSARRACVAVRDLFVSRGGSYRVAHARPGPIGDGSMKDLRLDDGSHVEADAFVFACGPWLGRLFPAVLGDAIQPTRQEVLYFGTPPGSQRYSAHALPIWIDFGERIFYGIPDLQGGGFKVADDTRGELFDPTNGSRKPTDEAISRARSLLAQRFPELANAPLLSSEVCQYENSPDGHLIIDRHPEAKNVWLVGGGSGHGFKLAPAIGEMTAEQIISGKALPEMFNLERLRDASKRRTQFDTIKKE